MIKRENLGFVLIVIGLLIAIYFTIFGNFMVVNSKFDPDILSKYGGFIGGTVGILFSLAGYLIIFETFRLQRKQQFENTFFNLFSQFNDYRTNQIGLLNLENEKYEINKGYMFFEILFEKDLGLKGSFSKTNFEKIKSALIKHSSHLGRFYSHINMLIHFIYNSNSLNKSEQEFYMNYLHNQLSAKERFIVKFYFFHPNYKDFDYLKQLDIKDTKDFLEINEDVEQITKEK